MHVGVSVVVSAVNCVCCKSERELDQITKSLGTRLTPIPTREGEKMRAAVKANGIAMRCRVRCIVGFM